MKILATIKIFLFLTSKVEGPILSLWIRYICVAQRNFENQGLITEVKKIFALINDCRNIIAYWEESKQSEALADSFHIVDSWWGWGWTAQPRDILQFVPSFKFGNSISSS